jgi:hypothetical protein
LIKLIVEKGTFQLFLGGLEISRATEFGSAQLTAPLTN